MRRPFWLPAISLVPLHAAVIKDVEGTEVNIHAVANTEPVAQQAAHAVRTLVRTA
tara:strand:+ start:55741 stop:55905 length:165 start_codon:yes stop_codon:yes gene_type:complete